VRYVRVNDGVFVNFRLVMAGLDPAIHDFKGRPRGRPFFSAVVTQPCGSAYRLKDKGYIQNGIGYIQQKFLILLHYI
jgi:hypothetical protein